MRIQFVVVCFY